MYEEVYVADRSPKYHNLSTPMTISFGKEDREEVLYPHNDALVVTLLVTNYTTRRILINNSNSVDILFWETFTKQYNAILGRPTLNNLRVDTSTQHLKMKFPTNGGVGEARGKQALVQECYV